MDDFTARHLETWLDFYGDEEYRLQVESWIAAALLADPDALARGRSWPELRDIGREIMTDAAWDNHEANSL